MAIGAAAILTAALALARVISITLPISAAVLAIGSLLLLTGAAILFFNKDDRSINEMDKRC
ncbi:hypothetical protein BN59_03157 [Legionella massiliensis]|uniref:Uncharacterized protein n=1 Tax=Legionella massiliensis TaxID=1034943 RepID=A0A078L4J3_9GAMM|nr:hypothetical protein [Legionella massiliensis]CDZ78843.1 hypothetical protein BN59_03157 [Legionella massiliensis]CEE14581.1 hypothetical protein BN1094_03157 [Legionella massiliensis]